MQLENVKLAIIDTHPIQYNSPLYKVLTKVAGFKVKIFYTWENGSEKFDKEFGKHVEWDIDLTEGFEFTYVSNSGKMSRSFFGVKNPNLEKAILEWGATHILVNGWSYYSHLRVLFRLRGKVKILFKGDSHMLDEKPGIRKLFRHFFLTLVYSNLDACLYVGGNNKNYFLKHGVARNKLFYSPHAIDNDRFALINQTDKGWIEKTKKEFSIKETDVVIVFCGKFQEKKNPQLLLEAVKILNKNNLHVIFVGNGKLESALKEGAYKIKNIHFLPFQNQSIMPSVYRLGDIFCLPSKGPNETWGLAVNEAMACGLPVMVSDKCGCNSDLLDDGVNGILIINSNIYQALLRLKSLSKDVLQNMGNESLKIIKKYNYIKASEGVIQAVSYTQAMS